MLVRQVISHMYVGMSSVICRVHHHIDKHDTLWIGLIHIWPKYINFNINY